MEDVGNFIAILSNLRPNVIFYGNLVHFAVISSVLVCCAENILATLVFG
jgi:hypothetical protein